MATTSSPVDVIPHIHLLCLLKHFSTEFDTASTKYYPELLNEDNKQVTTHFGLLDKLPEDLRFDAIVSPANSYGRLDGAFDDAISRALSPKDDYHWVTRRAQKVLYDKWKGFAPPGTCTVVPLIDEIGGGSAASARDLPWDAKYILLCPTMRIPQPVQWDREVVYECIWSMLCSIDAHNKAAANESDKIRSILMTPLATGVGMVPYKCWAEQCVLAIRDWVKAANDPEKFSNLSWAAIFREVKDVRRTWEENVPGKRQVGLMDQFLEGK